MSLFRAPLVLTRVATALKRIATAAERLADRSAVELDEARVVRLIDERLAHQKRRDAEKVCKTLEGYANLSRGEAA